MRGRCSQKETIIFLCLAVAFLFPSISGRIKAGTVDRRIIESINKFGINVLRSLDQDSTGNIFISPLSIATVLTMLADGAEGDTRDEIVATLKYPGFSENEINEAFRSLNDQLRSADSSVTFETANSIWCRQGFDVDIGYLDLSRAVFEASVREILFDNAAVDTINGWVSEKTHGKIESILDKPMPSDLVMILINAIYFYGNWKDPFDEKITNDDFFFRSDKSKIPCRMMSRTGKYLYFENERFQLIEIFYGNGIYNMTVVLPAPDLSVDCLIASLDFSDLDHWIRSTSYREGSLYLPKFKIEYEKELSKVLESLGMKKAFDWSAEFDRMSPIKPLFVDFVKHKTFIKVDEKGTEAAAITVTGTTIGWEPPRTPFVMRVDRPFLLLIRNNTSGLIIFAGKITEVGD